AFEVAVKIVDELEAVKVHQNEGEGAARACRTLPFSRKRFHEKAVGLDAGQAIGDGLLLSFLEGKRVVQSAGDQVGQRTKKQNLFLGEFDGKRRFDVQHTVQLFGVEHWESDGGSRIRQERFVRGVHGGGGLVVRQLAAARDMANEAGAKRNAAAKGAAACAGFGLHDEFARRVLQHADADVIVS